VLPAPWPLPIADWPLRPVTGSGTVVVRVCRQHGGIPRRTMIRIADSVERAAVSLSCSGGIPTWRNVNGTQGKGGARARLRRAKEAG